MARLRKSVACRNLERPYTRFSKFKELNYVRSRPVCKVVRFDMGAPTKSFDCTVNLASKTGLQIRDNSIESARQACNRILEKSFGKTGYHLKLMIYPHHIIRENVFATGAGADRISTGMAHSFGKPVAIAAQVKKGQTIFKVKVNKAGMATVRRALKIASQKLPCGCLIAEE